MEFPDNSAALANSTPMAGTAQPWGAASQFEQGILFTI